jgi:hypothetical protein
LSINDHDDFEILLGFDLCIPALFRHVPLIACGATALISWNDDEGESGEFKPILIPGPVHKTTQTVTLGYSDDDDDGGPGYAVGHSVNVFVSMVAQTPLGTCKSPIYELHG